MAKPPLRASRRGVITISPELAMGLVVSIVLLISMFALVPKLYAGARGSEEERLVKTQFENLYLKIEAQLKSGTDFSSDILPFLSEQDVDYVIIGFDTGEPETPVLQRSAVDSATWITTTLKRPAKQCQDPTHAAPACLCLYAGDDLVNAKQKNTDPIPVSCHFFDPPNMFFSSRLDELLLASQDSLKYRRSQDFANHAPYRDMRLHNPSPSEEQYYQILEIYRVKDTNVPLNLYIEKSTNYFPEGGVQKPYVFIFLAPFTESMRERENILSLCPAQAASAGTPNPALDACAYKAVGSMRISPQLCTGSNQGICTVKNGACELQCIESCFDPNDPPASKAITTPCICDGDLAYAGTCVRASVTNAQNQQTITENANPPSCPEGQITTPCMCLNALRAEGYCTYDKNWVGLIYQSIATRTAKMTESYGPRRIQVDEVSQPGMS